MCARFPSICFFAGADIVPTTTEEGGRLGLCYMPGKKVKKGRDGYSWNRSLKKDLLRLKSESVSTVVCLLNEWESRSLGVTHTLYRKATTSLGLNLIIYPIIEMNVPSSFEEGHDLVQKIVTELRNTTEVDHDVIVHCRGGVGRAGTIAACVMLYLGEVSSSDEAIRLVRKRRSKRAIECRTQENYIHMYARYLIDPNEVKGLDMSKLGRHLSTKGRTREGTRRRLSSTSSFSSSNSINSFTSSGTNKKVGARSSPLEGRVGPGRRGPGKRKSTKRPSVSSIVHRLSQSRK